MPDTPHKRNNLAGYLKTSKYVKQHGFSKNQIEKRFNYQKPKKIPGVIEISDCNIPRVVIDSEKHEEHNDHIEPRDDY